MRIHVQNYHRTMMLTLDVQAAVTIEHVITIVRDHWSWMTHLQELCFPTTDRCMEPLPRSNTLEELNFTEDQVLIVSYM